MTAQATAEGTARYAARFDEALPGNFRQSLGLHLSSLGIGTYLGEPDEACDAAYADALALALEDGINVIDTAINYRFQRSERIVGAVLKRLFDQNRLARDEVIVASKGGYLTFDGEMPPDPRAYFKRAYLDSGLIEPDQLVDGSHCLAPRYLEAMLERSLANLGLSALDVYFLHNPETQLGRVSPEEFALRIRTAFELLEREVAKGRIKVYGVATWNGLREPVTSVTHLSLARLAELATEVGGPRHHFRAVQLPFNLAMPEALTSSCQQMGDRRVSLLKAAGELDIMVWASASLLQGQLSRGLPPFVGEALHGLDTDAQRALQFVRSTPGIDVALVGMKSVAHVRTSLDLLRRPPASADDYARLFAPPET